MIDPGHALPLADQAQQLWISRGIIYDLSRPVADANLVIMRQFDELHLLYPFAESRSHLFLVSTNRAAAQAAWIFCRII